MKRPNESDYTSQVAYARALEEYCDTLAQPAQEPVAWMTQARNFVNLMEFTEAEAKLYGWTPVYIAPPAAVMGIPTTGDYAMGYAEGFNDACKRPAQEPIYQMQMMDGKWIDQAKQSYESNKTHGHTMRIVYTTPPAAPVQVWRDALERIADPRNTHFAGDAQIVAREALYPTPHAAQRPWVGLTDEQRTEIRREHYARTLPLMDAVEAKLKEKNT